MIQTIKDTTGFRENQETCESIQKDQLSYRFLKSTAKDVKKQLATKTKSKAMIYVKTHKCFRYIIMKEFHTQSV